MIEEVATTREQPSEKEGQETKREHQTELQRDRKHPEYTRLTCRGTGNRTLNDRSEHHQRAAQCTREEQETQIGRASCRERVSTPV